MRQIPITRRDFQRLADLRATEAGVLVRGRKQAGAFYLAGYAVECALKACIARQTRRHEFPPKLDYVRDIYTHKLENLLRLAGLEQQLERDMKTNANLASNWGAVKDWGEDSRYKFSGLRGRELYLAVTEPNGVLPWIKQRW